MLTGKWYYYNTTTSTWTAGGVYQSTLAGDSSIDVNNLKSTLRSSLNLDINNLSEKTTGQYVNSSGNLVTSAGATNYCTVLLQLHKGDSLTFRARGSGTNVTIIGILKFSRNDVNSYEPIITSTDSQTHDFSHVCNYDGLYVISSLTSELSNINIATKTYSKNNVDLLEDKLNTIDNVIKDDNEDLTANKYIRYSDGAQANFSQYSNYMYVTDYIEIKENEPAFLRVLGKSISFSPSLEGLAFYTENKTFISGVQYTNNSKIEFTIPEKAKYIRLTVTSNMYIQGFILAYKTYNKNIATENEENDINFANLYKTFLNVGCIGDSLTSGACAYHDANQQVHYPNLFQYSWPQYMAKNSGNKYINFSTGGLTTRSWLTNSNGLTKAQNPDNKCELYIIALGVNDISELGSEYIGTSEDIDLNDPDNNEDTFYGNYGKIIQKMKEVQPKAKFILMTVPTTGQTPEAFNEAIRNLSTIFTDCYLLDLASNYMGYFSTGSFIVSNKRMGHFNAIAYEYMSNLFGEWISKIMLENIEDFRQIEFIGTDYEW